MIRVDCYGKGFHDQRSFYGDPDWQDIKAWLNKCLEEIRGHFIYSVTIKEVEDEEL